MLNKIARLRLASQRLGAQKFERASEVVRWMGALQAQDAAMVKWALGVRMSSALETDINEAIARGEILRTHVLRPTWHLVSANDIRWMLTLSAPHIKSGLASRHAQLGLTDDVLTRSNSLLEKSLRDGAHMTREELKPLYAKANIATDENRLSHLLVWAELCQLVCSGAEKNGKHSYVLLANRAAPEARLTRDEALEQLALRYFVSRGPATLADFAWWSGLPMADARRALDAVKSQLDSIESDAQTYWLTKGTEAADKSVLLLPAFDEFIISYQDRNASLFEGHQRRAISDNGIFRPVIVRDGEVIGIWKRSLTKKRVSVIAQLFATQNTRTLDQIATAAADYAQFVNLPLDFQHQLYD